MLRARHAPDKEPGQRHPKETIMRSSTTSASLRGLVASAIFGVLALGLSVVSAADPGAASRTVKFSDLNTSSPSGAHVLYIRIRAAARVVCSYYFFATDTDRARCVHDATADAVSEINQPALSAVYNANHGT
jgi:UrcA family protein